MATSGSVTARAWIAFAAVSTLWGIPYLFIKVAVDDGVPPAFLAWARVVLGAAVLLALAWQAGLLGSLRGHWRWLLVYAVVEISLPFPLIGFGEQRVSSSLAAILIAAVPMLIAVMALRFNRDERVDRTQLIGLLIGFAGVIALVGIDVSGSVRELVGAGAVLLAAVGYAAGPMVLRRPDMRDLDPRATMAASLLLAALLLTPAAMIAPPESMPSGEAIGAIVVLGLFCTAAAFVLFGVLLAEVGAGKASVITYVAPVVAVALGVTVLDERPGVGAVAGLLLIIAGSWLSTDGRLPPGLARRLGGRHCAARDRAGAGRRAAAGIRQVPTTAWHIRPAAPADARAIARIHVDGWREGYRGLMPAAVLAALSVDERERQWNEWLGPGAESSTTVAEAGDRIGGFCTVITPARESDPADRIAEITALYVAPSEWRTGAGRALLAATLDRLRTAAWRTAFLHVLEGNARAFAFYERFGFTLDGTCSRRTPEEPPGLGMRAPL